MNSAARIAYPVKLEDDLASELASNEQTMPDEEGPAAPEPAPRSDVSSLDDVEHDEEDEVLSAQELGRKGEDAATRYLELRGYDILHRNWTCRFGEADIIARDPEGVLCFIEVKTRRGVEAGLPEEAITRKKQARYERIALCYLMDDDEWEDNDPVRFDAIGICVSAPHRALLRHHRGCFDGCF